jgi:hypothetical protein
MRFADTVGAEPALIVFPGVRASFGLIEVGDVYAVNPEPPR